MYSFNSWILFSKFTLQLEKKNTKRQLQNLTTMCVPKKKNGSLNFISVHNILELIKGMKPPDTWSMKWVPVYCPAVVGASWTPPVHQGTNN